MSAEVLREAARLMRERAEAATPGPWESTAGVNLTGAVVRQDAGPGRRAFIRSTWRPDAEHIASWHPAVALAVADWLDSEDTHRFGPTEHAIAVARAYLGEAS